MRLACVQSDVHFHDPEANWRVAETHLRTLAAQGVELVVFPEAYLTGYAVATRADAEDIALPEGFVSRLEALCAELGVGCVMGYIALIEGQLRNVATLVEPGLAARTYFKTHLPELGVDHFVEPGRELPVFDTRWGRIGLLICFDIRIPEAARSLALAGADLIILPTNWPTGADNAADYFTIVRANENRVFFAACDRVGTENGFTFIGKSSIVDPSGKVLAKAGDQEEILIADLNLDEARVKRTVTVPGVHETTVFECRQPELYRKLSESL